VSTEIADFLGDGPADEEPEIQVDEPLDMRPDLTEIGIVEIERGVCEDNYENRTIIRRAKLRYQALYDQNGRATGLINVVSPESYVERRIMALAEKRPLMVDPDNRNSDYLTGLDLLLDDRALAITPPWVVGSTKKWVAQEANGGEPEPGRRRSEGLPGRCRMIKTDTIRCMLWHSGRPKDDNLCRIHLKATRRAGEDVERARKKLTQAAPYAVDVLEELMESAESEPVRLKASTEILDRAGVRGGQDFTIDMEVTDNRPASQVVMERLARLALGAQSVQERLDREELQDIEDAEVVEDSDQGSFEIRDEPPQNGASGAPGAEEIATTPDTAQLLQARMAADLDISSHELEDEAQA
jgi:hypothetical protein